MEDGCDKQKIYVSCVWHSLCLFLSIKQSVVDISTHHNYGGGGSSNLIFDYTLMRFRRINGWGHGAKGKSEAKERERRLRLKWSAVQFILVEPLHSHDFIKAQIWNLISDWKILMIIPNLQSLKLKGKSKGNEGKSMQPKIDIPFRLLSAASKLCSFLHVWGGQQAACGLLAELCPGADPMSHPTPPTSLQPQAPNEKAAALMLDVLGLNVTLSSL